jgi:hypothetical protein
VPLFDEARHRQLGLVHQNHNWVVQIRRIDPNLVVAGPRSSTICFFRWRRSGTTPPSRCAPVSDLTTNLRLKGGADAKHGQDAGRHSLKHYRKNDHQSNSSICSAGIRPQFQRPILQPEREIDRIREFDFQIIVVKMRIMRGDEHGAYTPNNDRLCH